MELSVSAAKLDSLSAAKRPLAMLQDINIVTLFEYAHGIHVKVLDAVERGVFPSLKGLSVSLLKSKKVTVRELLDAS